MKQWNIWNTTIRNPFRIKDWLVLLSKFEGKQWDYDVQDDFYKEAQKEWIIDSKNDKGIEWGGQLFARKWVACFNQLWFARAWKWWDKWPIEITQVGKQLIKDEIDFEEAMLRQLLKYQLPSLIENWKDFKSFKVHPFRVFLEVLFKLSEAWIKGLTKEEVWLYIITTLSDNDIENSYLNIKEYRKKRSTIKWNNPKLKFYTEKQKEVIENNFSKELTEAKKLIKSIVSKYKSSSEYLNSEDYDKQLRSILFWKEPKKQRLIWEITAKIKSKKSVASIYNYYLSEFSFTKWWTLKDYSDSQIRYCLTTWLFSLHRDRIIIKENKFDLIKDILSSPSEFIDDKKYLDYLYNPEMPKLPLDNKEFLLKNIKDLSSSVNELSKQTGIDVNIELDSKANIPKLKKTWIELEKNLIIQKEYLFYKNQWNNDQIDDIVEYFDMIKSRSLLWGDAYFPAYYEWVVWRMFLAINTLEGAISETRNFQIDIEMKPIHHARSNVPDMVFNYSNFTIVCEVTLHQSISQWSAEYISVPKHVGRLSATSNKDVVWIFVAPVIDPNMAQQLYKADWHVEWNYIDLNIIPFSTDQLIKILQNFKDTHFTVKHLENCLNELIDLKRGVSNWKEWYEEIDKYINWKFVSLWCLSNK